MPWKHKRTNTVCCIYTNSRLFLLEGSLLRKTQWAATVPNSPQTLLTSQCSSLWSICLSGATRAAGEWGVVDVQRGRQGGGVGGLEGLRGSLHRAQSCLCGGTRTVIKDSTAASTWFACLIICHMLNITAISHIRAPPLQQASLRLHESVGGGRPHAASDADSPFFSIWNDSVALKLRPLRKAQPSPRGSFLAFFARYHKTQFHLHKWKLNKIQNGIIFWNSSSAFGLNPRSVWLFTIKKKNSQNFNVTFLNRFRAAIIWWITD